MTLTYTLEQKLPLSSRRRENVAANLVNWWRPLKICVKVVVPMSLVLPKFLRQNPLYKQKQVGMLHYVDDGVREQDPRQKPDFVQVFMKLDFCPPLHILLYEFLGGFPSDSMIAYAAKVMLICLKVSQTVLRPKAVESLLIILGITQYLVYLSFWYPRIKIMDINYCFWKIIFVLEGLNCGKIYHKSKIIKYSVHSKYVFNLLIFYL